jgi:Ni,Fe-hydrogenase III small subunit
LRQNVASALRPPPEIVELRPRSAALDWLARHPAALILRHLDCGSCNACDEELNALNSPVYDLEQYGIYIRSSPVNADYLAMTGPLTRGLAQPAMLTLDVMTHPAIIAIGDCALGQGPFAPDGAAATYAIAPRPKEMESAIVLRIPGCPPSPGEILGALAEWIWRR